MAPVRSALCAVLLGGCLIVRQTDEHIEPPCPDTKPELVADSGGPLVVADAIYFVGANGTLSRISKDGGPVSELTNAPIGASAFAADADYLYWGTDDSIWRKPFDGSSAKLLAEGYTNLTRLVVDDANVVWASSGSGIDAWSKTDETVSHLADAELILGLGASEGVYYYTVTHGNVVRRTPPTQDLATAEYPGRLIVDERGVYFSEIADPFVEYAGALRLVPREGGSVVTTLDNLLPVADLTSDDTDLFFATIYGAEYRIKQVSRFGGEAHTLACGYPSEHEVYLAVAGDYLYYSDLRGLYRIPKYSPLRF